ncbi:MAG: prolipoprotein diacylglyceryl transferase [Egibacteraceae bacterium]
MSVIAALAWPILERIPIYGDFQISPHGISIAVGFLLGAQLMLGLAQRRGVAHRPVADIPDIVWSLATRAAIGGIIGARFFYIITHLDMFPDPLGWLRVWEGGLSLLGGVTGAVLAGIPYAVRRRLSLRLLLDSLAPGLALGIFLGRIGDLVIGEHLGGETTFFLGWRCTGAFGDPRAPYPWPGPQVQGCYDAVLHQTALYDFLAGGLILAVLLVLARRPRFDGFFAAMFVALYGGGRFLSDFARDADRDLVGTLTGSQVTVLAAIAAVGLWLVLARPWRSTPYAWSPPDFAHSWGSAPPPAQALPKAGVASGEDGQNRP